MIKKTPFFASSTNLVTVLLFFISQLYWQRPRTVGETPPVLLLHPALILSIPIFSLIYFLTWLAILCLISQEILKCTTLNHYHMIIPSAMG